MRKHENGRVQASTRRWPGLALAAMLVTATPMARAADAWTDTPLARWQALALMQTLSANVLASRSATATLEAWCGEHALAFPARIVAKAMAGAGRPPTAEQRRRLQVDENERIVHRRVQLACGDTVLSEADNWYVPARLTDEMNRVLETTDTPFGRVVRDLGFYRLTFAADLLWSPVAAPPSATGTLDPPAGLFAHRALLHTRENIPFSEVHETYQRGVLAFPQPAPQTPGAPQ